MLIKTSPQVPEFISQRRRWLNGSLFASFHSTIFFYRIWTSGQNPIRMLVLQVCITWRCISPGLLTISSCRSSSSTMQSSSFSPGRRLQTFIWPFSLLVMTSPSYCYDSLIWIIIVGFIGNYLYRWCFQLPEPRSRTRHLSGLLEGRQ